MRFTRAERLKAFPPYSRWIIPRLRNVHNDQLMEIVRILDDAMKNTSLILLFDVGGKRFLFPGDAQIENWSYALGQMKENPELKKLLASVELYKVGHHGSLNATPKSIWVNFKRRKKTKSHRRLNTVLSTMGGKYGSAAKGTEVPRKKLVEALESESSFFSTQELKKKSELKRLFEINL